MRPLIRLADQISTMVGQAFSWLVIFLVTIIVYEVFSRYVLHSPHDWVYDVSNMTFGALFLMGGAYALAKENHVRGDILYGFFSPRVQAGLDLSLYLLFFVPGIVALVWSGYGFAEESWSLRERSANTADGPVIYPIKMLIPLAGGLLMLQGLAEMIRCVYCLRTGQWAAREEDIEEVDVSKLKEQLQDNKQLQGA